MPLFKRRHQEAQPIDMEARSEETGLKYKDLLVLGQMLQGGADLTQPRHALYFLYFDTREAAATAAARATAAGYEAEAREPISERPDEWCVVAERHDVVLDPPSVNAADDLFQGLADELGGQFDGWEAALLP
jgi:hypothetical protein